MYVLIFQTNHNMIAILINKCILKKKHPKHSFYLGLQSPELWSAPSFLQGGTVKEQTLGVKYQATDTNMQSSSPA